jgi:hypothetical protein
MVNQYWFCELLGSISPYKYFDGYCFCLVAGSVASRQLECYRLMWYARPKNVDGCWCCDLLNCTCVKLRISNFMSFLRCILYIWIILIFDVWFCWSPWAALLELILLLVLLRHMSSRSPLLCGTECTFPLFCVIIVFTFVCVSVIAYSYLARLLSDSRCLRCGWFSRLFSVVMPWTGCWQGLVLLSTDIVVMYSIIL